MSMGIEMAIALVLSTALLWIVVTLAMLSAIDRPERKARRQERKSGRGKRPVRFRSAVRGSRLTGRGSHRTLHPH